MGYSQLEKALRDAIHNCDVKFYSDDPSFYWQGVFEDLDKKNMSIYKFPGPNNGNGNGVWRDRHALSGGLQDPYIRLTKHLAQVVNEIDSYIKEIAQNLYII